MSRRKRRGNSRYFFIFLVICSFLTGLFYGAGYLLQRINYFQVRDIQIVGNKNLAKDFLKDVAEDYYNKNLFSFKGADVSKKYSNIVRVKSVKISKIIPHTLRITVTERVGYFYLKSIDGVFFPIDKDKYVLDRNYTYKEDLPIINVGRKSSQIVIGRRIGGSYINTIYLICEEITKINTSFVDNISEFYKKDNQIYFVDSESGSRIVLGEGNLKEKLERLIFLKENKGFEKNSIIDFQYTNQVISRQENR